MTFFSQAHFCLCSQGQQDFYDIIKEANLAGILGGNLDTDTQRSSRGVNAQKKDQVKTQQEGTHLWVKERGLREKQTN